VAGARRDREAASAPTTLTAPTAPTAPTAEDVEPAPPRAAATARPTRTRPTKTRPATSRPAARETARRPRRALALALALLCLAALAGGGVLLWQRLDPRYVDPTVFSATRAGVEAVYAYDYRDRAGSVQGKLAVLTGDLREQYENDLEQGGILDTYDQVSATTSYEVVDVGLQRINDAQDTATLVVFGQYVVTSVNSGRSDAPEGSECRVTSAGAQSCTQTVQVGVTKVDGEWKIDALTLLTTS
jgi:hypothetical protein